MVATTLEEGRSLPEHINLQQRGLLQAFLAEPGARDFLGHIKDGAEEVATDGGEHVDIQDKFRRAGLENEYPLHRMLGASVHNDFGTLQQRHAERSTDGTRRLALFRVPTELDLLNFLDRPLRVSSAPIDQFTAVQGSCSRLSTSLRSICGKNGVWVRDD